MGSIAIRIVNFLLEWTPSLEKFHCSKFDCFEQSCKESLETSSMEFFCKDFEQWNFWSNGASLRENLLHNKCFGCLNKIFFI
jgi:hypothetical protein